MSENLLVIQTTGGSHDYVEFLSHIDARYGWARVRAFQVQNDPGMVIDGEVNPDVSASDIASIFTASASQVGWNKLVNLTIKSAP